MAIDVEELFRENLGAGQTAALLAIYNAGVLATRLEYNQLANPTSASVNAETTQLTFDQVSQLTEATGPNVRTDPVAGTVHGVPVAPHAIAVKIPTVAVPVVPMTAPTTAVPAGTPTTQPTTLPPAIPTLLNPTTVTPAVKVTDISKMTFAQVAALK